MPTIELTDKQSILYHLLDNKDNRRILVEGGSRAGKTLAIITWLITQMIKYPGIKILILRKHRTHIRTTLYNGTLKELLRCNANFTFNDTSMEITHTNGSTLRCDGIDDKERVDKILGSEYAIIFANEASQLEYHALKIVISRLSQQVEGLEKRTLVLDTNPKSQYHWIYRLCLQGVDPETNLKIADKWSTMSFSPLDNPFLPKDTVESLQNLTGVERKRLYEGLWVNVEGLAYPCFSPELHIKEIDKSLMQSWIIGVDCGNNDPMVLALYGIYDTPKGKALHLQDLYYEPGKDMSRSLADVAEKWKELNPYITVDPSASPAIVELKARGFRCEPANNKVRDGITTMRDLLQTNRLSFSPQFLDKVVEEISQYELDSKTELPIGGTVDHLLDATRYAVMAFQSGVGNKRIVCVF